MMKVETIDCVFETVINSDVLPYISPQDLKKNMRIKICFTPLQMIMNES